MLANRCQPCSQMHLKLTRRTRAFDSLRRQRTEKVGTRETLCAHGDWWNRTDGERLTITSMWIYQLNGKRIKVL